MYSGWFFWLKPVVFKSAKIPEAIVFHSDPYSVLSTTVLNDFVAIDVLCNPTVWY